MSNDYKEWQKLCEEHHAARDAIYEALGPVNQKFSAIADGKSQTNPSDQELNRLDEAWKRWENVKRRMEEFIKKRR